VGRLWSQLTLRKSASEIVGVAVDAIRSRRELVIENAVLRHQVNVLPARAPAMALPCDSQRTGYKRQMLFRR